jgi:hypothetical protein
MISFRGEVFCLGVLGGLICCKINVNNKLVNKLINKDHAWPCTVQNQLINVPDEVACKVLQHTSFSPN